MAHAWHDTVNDATMIARKRSAREIFVRVFAYLRRYPWFGVGTMTCAILSTIAGLAFPKLIQVMIDDVIVPRNLDALPLWVGIIFGAALCGIMAGLVILLGFLAAFLSDNPGYAMLGACMLCLPVAVALAVAAWVLWKL